MGNRTLRLAVIVAFALCIALPTVAQERGRPEGSSSSTGSSAGDRSVPGGGSSSTSSSVASGSFSTSSAPSRDFSPTYSSARGGYSGGSGSGYTPRIEGTSFVSMNYYYDMQNFFWYLQRMYALNPTYFSRFYRNREPLLTPTILKLAVRQPLRQALSLLQSVDDLEALLAEKEAGRPVDKLAIAEKTKEIRDLAKNIRSDQALTQIDQRLDQDAFKGMDPDKLGLEAVARLREVANDLTTQLRNMYEDQEPATVSVQSLKMPSFTAMTKQIDRLTKVIDSSARRI